MKILKRCGLHKRGIITMKTCNNEKCNIKYVTEGLLTLSEY